MKPEIRIFKDIEALSHAAAGLFVEQASEAITQRGRFLVALNGGTTPARLFDLLAGDPGEQLDWNKVHVFWGDERCVPPEDPGSSYGQARAILLSRVPLPDTNIHRIVGELGPVQAAYEYALVLRQFSSPGLDWPRFDLVYLGMGEDGHTASLFPGSPVEMTEPTLPVSADYQDRPANRVTLTPAVFNSAHRVVFMVTGKKKAEIVAEVLRETLNRNPQLYPAQRIQPEDGRLVWLLDDEAASKLNIPR